MKAKYALIALLAITFWGCDDNTAGLGLGMFPGSDQNINGKLSTFDVTTESLHDGGYGKPGYKSAISCSATGDDFVLLHALGFLYL